MINYWEKCCLRTIPEKKRFDYFLSIKKASSPCANTANLATIALVNVTLVQLGMTMGKSMQEDLERPGNWCKYYGMTTFHWAWLSLGGNIICGTGVES